MWNNFEQSPIEDETISNAFSSRGIFRISSDDEISQHPHVLASVQNKKMVMAIDKSLFLLEDEMIAKCFVLSFNASIDVMVLSQTGNMIVCGLSDGEVHGIYIKGTPLFNQVIKAVDIRLEGAKTFVGIQQMGMKYFLTCCNGSVYCLSDIDETPLDNILNISLGDNEILALANSFNDVVFERLLTTKGLNELTAALLINPFFNSFMSDESDEKCVNSPMLIAGTQGAIYIRCTQEDVVRLSLPAAYNGVKCIYNLENFIVLLTNSGHLLEICPITKLILYSSISSATSLLIDDLIVMESNDENIELLVLTKICGEDEWRIRMIDYPALKCHYELDVAQYSFLVQQPKFAVNLYYLSGSQINSNNLPSVLEMILVSETHPIDRFKKLIAKGHLEEAEAFGQQFELCLQPFYEAKSKKILMDMNTLGEKSSELLNKRFNDLMQLLHKIENKQFFRDNYMFTLPSRQIMEKYLKEVSKHLDEEDDEQYISEIVEQLDRLKTLAILDPYEINIDWLKFVHHPNLVKYINNLLKANDPTACLIWKRHSCAILSQQNEKELRKMLGLIPVDTKPFNILQWLRQFVPVVSSTHPTIMPFITDWSIEKTRSLQYSDLWPEIGLEFSTKVAEIFEDIHFMHSDVRRQHERNIGKIRDLVNALQDLFVLKKTYNLIFTLDNYLQDSIDETAKCILLRVHLDNLKSLVNDFLYPIYQEKGQSPVAALRRYIRQLVASRNSFSTWLERSVACIELLHNEDDRLESALLVLQNSPVPWPESVAPLIKLRYSTHPLALKINTEYEIQVIKIMKGKYNWPTNCASDMNLNLFMFRIVQMDLPDMLDDIRILTKVAPDIATGANFNCCYQLVRRGKPDVAYTFFKSLKANNCAEVTELFAEVLVNSAPPLTEAALEEQRKLIDFFKFITPHSSSNGQKRLQMIQNRFVLRYKYELTINDIVDLGPHKNRLEFLASGIEIIVNRSRNTDNICEYIFTETCELALALDLSKVFAVKELCKRMKCLVLSCALTFNILEIIICSEDNKNDFIELAIELLAQQIQLTVSSQNCSTLAALLNNNDPLAFPLVHELLVKASIFERNETSDLLELIQYIRIGSNSYSLEAIEMFYEGRDKEISKLICDAIDVSEISVGDTTLNLSTALNQSFDIKQECKPKKRYSVNVFDEVAPLPLQQVQVKVNNSDNMRIVTFVARTLLFMVLQSSPTNCLLLKLKACILGTTNEKVKFDLDGARDDFFASLEHLIKNKMHDVWYIMAQYLMEYQQRNNCKIINSDFVSLQMCRVFRNMLSLKDVNFLDLTVMLTTDPHANTLLEKLDRDLKTDQQRANLLILTEMYYAHFGETTNVEAIKTKRLKHFYYMEFCKQDPSIKGKFNPDIDAIDQLLLKEFQNKQLDVNLLQRMSRDFNLDCQKILITQVISILQAQEMQYEIKTDSFGDEELVMITTVESMRNLCQPYINGIKNTDLLIGKLKQFIDEIHIYFYELYLCVIEILLYFDAVPKEIQVWSSILHFLKHKMISRRRNRPGQLENDMWFESQKEIGVLPKIARYRLPFKPIVEQPLKDILDSELNVDNCESWFPLIQMHTVLKGSTDVAHNCDYFCMSAVKNSIADYKSRDDGETWHLQPSNNAFLKSILRLVKHINNPSKAFMILYFVSNYAPDGADQVEASYECYKFALENEKLLADVKYKEHLTKIKRKYPVLKTQHLLYVYGLTDEKIMRLVENPSELIYQLYHHDVILKGGKLDINTVVNEIAELHNMSVDVIQFKLLQKWLSFTVATPDGTVMDETLFEDQHLADNVPEDSGNAAENVIRANYIINSWPKEVAVQFLVAHIFPTDGAVNTSKQLQMYECYFKLYDGSNSFNNMLSQKDYITIKCVHELKKLGYNSSVDKFSKSNKIDILKTIWKRNTHNANTMQILANICLGFDIYLPKVWNGVLKRMVMLGMVNELNALVDLLSSKPQLMHTEGLVMAWDCVLQQPFKNANQIRSMEQEDMLHKTLCRLQSCPVVHSLNLVNFAELCERLDRPHIAAVFLAFCRTAEQRNQIKSFISQRNSKLRQEILDLEDVGILSFILTFAIKELQL